MSNSALIAFANSPIPYPLALTWRAAVNRWTDADTVWVERDTGCRQSQLIELRITGINWKGFNAAERYTAAGKAATGFVQRIAPVRSIVRIETKPDTEKYGRWLSPVLVPLTNTLDVSFTIADEDVFERDGIAYLDLAAYIVRNVPGCVWQAY